MTRTEAMLWNGLRQDLPWKFRRQEPIDRFVVDFVCYSKRLVVEVDGSQHVDSEADRLRDSRLRVLGFQVMRVWSSDVMRDLGSVLQAIAAVASARPDFHRSRTPRERWR